MLYRIGTGREIAALQGTFSPAVIAHLQYCIDILDDAYGVDRDYLQYGGYSLLAETSDDIPGIREILDLDKHPCEWVKRLDGEYLSALYLLNDDYAVVVFLPVALAPLTLLNELEALL